MSAQSKLGSLVTTTLALFLVGATLTACSPKVYVIDNQTILEEEAAGTWPQFEKQILEKAKAKGPTPVSQIPADKHRQRLYNVMNGEMALNVAAVAKPASPAKVNGAVNEKPGAKPETKPEAKPAVNGATAPEVSK